MNPYPRTITAADLLRGVPTKPGPRHERQRLGHPEPARACEGHVPIPLEDGRDLLCGREIESIAA
jgi:hypothetical protein